MKKGAIQFMNPKGFGFVQEAGTGESFYVHVTHIPGCRFLAPGTEINFDIKPSPSASKRPMAVNISIVGEVATEAEGK